jgi:hypothetical protein
MIVIDICQLEGGDTMKPRKSGTEPGGAWQARVVWRADMNQPPATGVVQLFTTEQEAREWASATARKWQGDKSNQQKEPSE